MNLDRMLHAAGKRWSWLFLAALAVLLLTGCSGRQVIATSWPGIAVDDNLAYIAFNQSIYAVDPAAQLAVWQFTNPLNAKSTFYAAPALTDGLLVIGGYDNVLYGIDRDTLAIKWSFHLASDRYVGSPVVAGDRVYAATGGNELFSLRLQELDRLGAVEKADEVRRQMERAAVEWQFTSDHGMWAAPLVAADALYVTSLDHQIYALEADSGRVIWSKELPGAMAGTPLLSVDQQTLFVGNFDYSLYALDAATGEQRWKVESENWIWGQPVLAGEKLFFGDLGGFLYAINPGTGELLWKQQVADAIRGEPLYDPENGRLFVAGRKVANPGNISTRGVVLALDAESYRTLWEQPTAEAVYTSPVLSGDLLLVTPAQGESLMQTFNAETGVVQWRFAPTPEK